MRLIGSKMTEFINRTTASFSFWWTAWVEGAILLAISGLNAWIGATGNITAQQWTALPEWDRFKIYNPIIVALLVVLRGFMSNTMAQLQKKQANTEVNQTMKTVQNILLVTALLFMFGCAICPKTPYNGDAYLLRADQIIHSSPEQLKDFIDWEQNFRSVINDPKISDKAKQIRENYKQWISNAVKLRNAYEKIPDANVQDDLQAQLQVITDAINQANTIMANRPMTINIPAP